ncbi:MAG: hypothetical protein IJD68_03540 [Ruminococcus sp.]|nr:hypothetical protein [Ruminococcus sp.]
MKKVLSLLLVIVMMLGFIPYSSICSDAATTSVNVWPGQPMEIYDNTNNIYYFDIPLEYNCFIFSDGNYYYGYDDGIAWQTEDISFTGGNKLYMPNLNDTSYVNGATICSASSSTYNYSGSERIVFFEAPDNWETPSCYCWASDDYVYEPSNKPNSAIPSDAYEYNGNYYKVYSGVCNTWEEAEVYCEGLGGHLATITSEEENSAVYSYVISSGHKNAYFGYHDSKTEGKWEWVNGETSSYTNWHSNEPNSENALEDYAMFYYKYSDGKWNDGNFGQGTVNDDEKFICEWDSGEYIDYKLNALTAYPESTIGKEQDVKILFELYKNDVPIEINDYLAEVDNDNIVQCVDSTKSDKSIICTFKGINEGSTQITFTEKITNTSITLPITVEDKCEYYRCSVFPVPYASTGGIYIENYNCEADSNGTHIVTFDAYNSTYAYGVVAAYDEYGNFIKCAPLVPLSDGSGMEKVVNGFKYVWLDIKDIFDGDTAWYTKESKAQHTYVQLSDIPVNAEIIITADGEESMYPLFYTGVDVFVQTILAASSVDVKIDAQRATVKELVTAAIESIPQSVIQSVTEEMASSIAQGATGESVNNIYEVLFNMFESVGLNFGDIITSTLKGMGYGVADAIVTTAIPAYKIVAIVDQVLEIAWPITDYSYNCNRGKLEIHTTLHGQQNYIANSSIVVSQKEDFTEETLLDAYLVSNEDELKSIKNTLDNDSFDYDVYNITMRKNGIETQPDNIVTVKIPVTDSEANVYRVEDDGTLTDMKATYINGYLVFETDHFSYYAVAHKKAYEKGDANLDGTINILDATEIQRHLAQIIILDDFAVSVSDANGDGAVNIIDATTIQRFIAQLIPSL